MKYAVNQINIYKSLSIYKYTCIIYNIHVHVQRSNIHGYQQEVIPDVAAPAEEEFHVGEHVDL